MQERSGKSRETNKDNLNGIRRWWKRTAERWPTLSSWSESMKEWWIVIISRPSSQLDTAKFTYGFAGGNGGYPVYPVGG